jgi:hypothetical protein
MNIFFLDRSITKCAQAHCDKHINKMILESGQLLASVHYCTNPDAALIPGIYRLTHKNHPSAVWARASINNYIYLLDLMDALNEEAQYRYQHSKIHETLRRVREWPFPNLPDFDFEEPPRCVHDDFKRIPDTVAAYRAYYKRDKRDITTWTRRDTPEWFQNYSLDVKP